MSASRRKAPSAAHGGAGRASSGSMHHGRHAAPGAWRSPAGEAARAPVRTAALAPAPASAFASARPHLTPAQDSFAAVVLASLLTAYCPAPSARTMLSRAWVAQSQASQLSSARSARLGWLRVKVPSCRHWLPQLAGLAPLRKPSRASQRGAMSAAARGLVAAGCVTWLSELTSQLWASSRRATGRPSYVFTSAS